MPFTGHTNDRGTSVPVESLKLMKEVIGQNFPHLAELGFSESRVNLNPHQTILFHFS